MSASNQLLPRHHTRAMPDVMASDPSTSLRALAKQSIFFATGTKDRLPHCARNDANRSTSRSFGISPLPLPTSWPGGGPKVPSASLPMERPGGLTRPSLPFRPRNEPNHDCRLANLQSRGTQPPQPSRPKVHFLTLKSLPEKRFICGLRRFARIEPKTLSAPICVNLRHLRITLLLSGTHKKPFLA